MTFKSALIWLASTAAVFVMCSFVMLRFGGHMNAPAIVYPFIATWGISALLWPLYVVLAFRARNDR
jgi:hypothetical protein